jgi:hypothetical protein
MKDTNGTKSTKGTTDIRVPLDTRLHLDLRVYCLQHGTTLQKLIPGIIRHWAATAIPAQAAQEAKIDEAMPASTKRTSRTKSTK